MRLLESLSTLLALVVAAHSGLIAQDSQYWTYQFGSKSALLGGAVIGSVDDISSTFYNPGALGLIENPAFTVSANVFEFATLRLTDDIGRGIDLATSNTGLRPSLIAGTIKRDMNKKGGLLAYSALTRQSGGTDIQGLIIQEERGQFPMFQYDEVVINARVEGAFNDLWVGLTYSQPVSEAFSVGVTWYNALRSQRRRSEINIEAVDFAGTGVTDIEGVAGSYYTIRTLLKLGASLRLERFTAGVTLTTPGLHILGKGYLSINESYIDGDSSALASTLENDIAAKYHSPLSVGAGFGWKFDRFHLHVSGEWYSGIDSYEVMRGADWEVQKPAGVARELVSVHEQNGIFNWAVGLQYIVKERLNLYGSYYTDQSVRRDLEAQADLTTFPIDLNNVNVGSDLTIGRVRLDLGIGYSWGKQVDQELSEIISGTDQELIATFRYSSIKLLFGIEIGIGQ